MEEYKKEYRKGLINFQFNFNLNRNIYIGVILILIKMRVLNEGGVVLVILKNLK